MTTERILPGLRFTSMITGMFSDRASAECAYRQAVQLGYAESDINVVMSDATRDRLFPRTSPDDPGLKGKAAESAEKPGQGSELGGPAGGTMGTIAPVLAAAGTLALVPGILIAGPIAIALTAAGAVGLAGGLLGALANWGIPKENVREYEDAIRNGGILLGVKPKSGADDADLRREWRACGGRFIQE